MIKDVQASTQECYTITFNVIQYLGVGRGWCSSDICQTFRMSCGFLPLKVELIPLYRLLHPPLVYPCCNNKQNRNDSHMWSSLRLAPTNANPRAQANLEATHMQHRTRSDETHKTLQHCSFSTWQSRADFAASTYSQSSVQRLSEQLRCLVTF